MYCCQKRLIYSKTNFFFFQHFLIKSLNDLNVKLNMLVLYLSLKDNTEYVLNQYGPEETVCSMLGS